jgi:aspartate racemase
LRTIGLIGGRSWESSAHYYAILNRETMRRLGAPHSARCVMLSVDFAPIEAMQRSGAWGDMAVLLAGEARRAEAAGAECVLLCTNTMHLVADAIAEAVSIPMLHIADPTGAAVRAAGIGRVALLGTAFTMAKPFYRERLAERFGLEVIVPGEEDRATIHRIIYDELIAGVIRDESRAAYRAVIERLVAQGAEGVILGCTEIGLLVSAADSRVPLFDTTELHAIAAVDFALA